MIHENTCIFIWPLGFINDKKIEGILHSSLASKVLQGESSVDNLMWSVSLFHLSSAEESPSPIQSNLKVLS